MAAGAAEQLRERLQALRPQMSQLPLVSPPHRPIEPAQNLQTRWGDASHYRPPIFCFAASRDEAALLQPVEQASDVWVSRNHAVGDFPAGEAFRRAAKNPEHVVLRRRNILALQNL